MDDVIIAYNSDWLTIYHTIDEKMRYTVAILRAIELSIRLILGQDPCQATHYPVDVS